MPTSREDRSGLTLLVSLLILLLVSPFAAEGPRGESIFVLALYGAFAAATIELSQKKSLRLPSLTLAVCSFSVTLAAIYHPIRILWIATWTLMALFFGYVSVILFIHLGRPGRITRGRLYVSVSLYFLLGVFYFAIFNCVDLDSSRILRASWVAGSHRNDTRFSSVLQFRHADHAGIRRHRSGHAARADIGGAGGCNWSALHRHHRGASGRCLPAGRWRRELILERGGPLTKLHLLTILYLGPKERAPMRAPPRTSSAGLILY